MADIQNPFVSTELTQDFTSEQQTRARGNIGAASSSDLNALADSIAAPATANPVMDGTASVGASSKYAREDHVHPSDTSREAVTNKTTVVLGTSDSQYPTDKAVADFVNSSIATNTAHYISDNGDPFTSVAQLEAYTGTVTNNDYAFVTGTDSDGNTYYDRYKATVDGSTVMWALEYRLNNSSFTAAQWAAINSGITAALVAKIHEHSNKSVLDGITATKVSNWNAKMDKQTVGSTSTPIYLDNGVAKEATNISVASAAKLTTARNIHVDLESNAGANFDGSANVTPGVKGVLPQAFGGTGYSTVDTVPKEKSNKMVTSGGVWNFSAPANLGILSGSSVNVNNDFDNCDKFAVLVTSDVRLRTYWLSKKSGRIIEFYNLNDYQIAINVVIEIGQTVVFHRQGASDITWTNTGSSTSAQTLCQLSYKGYCKFYVTYNSTTDVFEIYQISDFLYATGTLTSSMIGNVGTTGQINPDTNAEKDEKTDIIYHHDIICNNATGYYAVNIERLIIGHVYRFQFLTQDGYTYLYNNSSETVTIYTGDTSFRVAQGWNANIQASSSAVSSHTVSVVRTSATMIYVIWGY